MKEFEKQYKDHLSGYHDWEQKSHADKWILSAKNIGTKLSIDETALTNGELYTIVTNKAGKGGKGSLVAIVEDIKTQPIIKEKKIYQPKLCANGDTKKQLLARSFHLLFKTESKWSERQAERAKILFKEFPAIAEAYGLAMMFRGWYENKTTKDLAQAKLQNWYQKVDEKKIASFIVAAQSIKAHEDMILNYFNNRSTNASSESFNAKLKGFRALVRGVRDIKFLWISLRSIPRSRSSRFASAKHQHVKGLP